MKQVPELIVMLTYNDHTVKNAAAIFEQAQYTGAHFWGMKEEGLPLPEMRALFGAMRACGKETVLEVVAYDEAAGLRGAQMAVDCGCTYLMGTMYYDSVMALCARHGIRYLPFVGRVSGRPSILEGSIEEMIAQGKKAIAKGAYGVDLLGYRYTGNAVALNRALVAALPAPVCLAGSINSFARLDEVRAAAPRAFTIGSAFFDGCFGDGFARQIDAVLAYLQK